MCWAGVSLPGALLWRCGREGGCCCGGLLWWQVRCWCHGIRWRCCACLQHVRKSFPCQIGLSAQFCDLQRTSRCPCVAPFQACQMVSCRKGLSGKVEKARRHSGTIAKAGGIALVALAAYVLVRQRPGLRPQGRQHLMTVRPAPRGHGAGCGQPSRAAEWLRAAVAPWQRLDQ